MSVTVVTCIFGEGRDHFLPGWIEATLAAGPDDVIVASDHSRKVTGDVRQYVSSPTPDWRWPIAWHWNRAFGFARTEWVWIMGVDDRIRPDALRLLEGRDEDVLQVGYHRDSDDMQYIPGARPEAAILAAPDNGLVGCVPLRRAAWEAVGGFPDVAFEDWGMWRRMARAGCRFGWIDAVAYDYHWDPGSNATTQYMNPANIAEALAQ